MQVAGVEDGDDGDRQQVVDHGQGQQEGPQRRPAGACRRRPARPGRTRCRWRSGSPSPAARRRRRRRLTSDEEQRRDGHPADRGHDRQRGPARVAQVAGDELPLELQPGDEEEDRQQAVGRPGAQRQVQVQRARPDREVPQAGVGAGPGRVRPDQRDHGGGQQQRPADGLPAQQRGDPGGLGPGAAREDRRGWVGVLVIGMSFRGRSASSPTRLPGTPGPTSYGVTLTVGWTIGRSGRSGAA